jgi:hypothetical protein
MQSSLSKIRYEQKHNSTYFAPIASIVQMNGLSSSPNPAITGWVKYGPNLKRKGKHISFLMFQHSDL